MAEPWLRRLTERALWPLHRLSPVRRHSLSLSLKAALIGLLLGGVVWQTLEWLQAEQLQKILEQELTARLEREIVTARTQFDSYMKQYNKIAQLFTLNQKLIDHLQQLPEQESEIISHRRPPAWLPRSSAWRGLIHPSHIMLIDKQQRLRELYRLRTFPLPESLRNPSQLMLMLAEEQNHLTSIEGQPYLLSLANAIDADGQTVGSLLIISPLDDLFLFHSQWDLHNRGVTVALIGGEQQQKILASSDPNELPAGTQIDSLQQSYIITGNAFFDYGASTLKVRFSTLLAKQQIAPLTSAVVELEHRQRLIAALVFIAAFVLLMLYYSSRLTELSHKTLAFTKETLGIEPDTRSRKGDEIEQLEDHFELLTKQVVQSQAMTRIRHDMEKKEQQLEILQAVTEELDVGVILCRGANGIPLTRQMEQFSDECGGSKFFLQQARYHRQLETLDHDAKRRIFKVRWLNLQASRSVLLVQEITELVDKTDALKYQALHDSLTGLPNRTLLMDRFQQAIRLAERNQHHCSLIIMDLDRFKEVNDTLGHHIGDQLLQKVVQRLSRHLRAADTFARLGGDEFALLLPNTDRQQAGQVASLLQRQLLLPIELADHPLSAAASMGICSYPDDGEEPQLLMQRADVAMYEAKRSRSGFAFYDPERDPNSGERLMLASELRQAIEENRLQLYYQPQQETRDGGVHSLEALIRWPHQRHGLLVPHHFLSIAEQSVLINPLTFWVIGQAIKQCALWNRQGHYLSISINIAAHTLQNDNLVGFIQMQLEKYQIKPEQLMLELTESTIMENPPKAQLILEELNTMGLQLSIDDFGTGYSSLAYLKQLPVTELKIDKSFVLNMHNNDNDAMIVRSTIELAHNLNLQVVAEGVENGESWGLLGMLGCDRLQGYYISRPMPAEAVHDWLLQHQPRKRSNSHLKPTRGIASRCQTSS